jgi:flagellar M-ring protein FliF
VVVDDRHITQAGGKIKTEPYTPEDINRFSDLVKQAVGFDSARGDQVTVTNAAFKTPEALEALPETPVLEQGWFLDLMKQVAAVLAVLFLILGVLRPTMRSLSGRDKEAEKAAPLADEQTKTAALEGGGNFKYNYNQEGVPVAASNPRQPAASESPLPVHMEDLLLIDVPKGYEKRLEYLQKIVDNDPRLVAQVIKRWVR